MSAHQYGLLAAAMALQHIYDRPRSLGQISIQSTESRERALISAMEKRERRAKKRAMIAEATRKEDGE